ncbi:NAD(P)-binding protein [Oceanobacillus salinisoli]|uniref:NAD(P)-binding protein n=1 Tax=Oceanobacillus salinisoli TaxID=2678611 RepID=UPI0012E1B347|nr:NAD(P)-binding protein [Oceanobacillus salinisoli]
MARIPLMLDLNEKNIVIVGGGVVAQRRVYSLVESGAFITVISPEVSEGIYIMWKQGLLSWMKKYFEPEDIHDAFLVIAATNHTEVNQSIKQVVPADTLFNMVEDVEQGNIEFPGYFKRGKLSISVSTGGSSPILTSKIKRDLEKVYDWRYEEYVDFLYECRKLIKISSIDRNEKKELLNNLLSDEFLNEDKQEKALEYLKRRLER